jgi:hypothetical protein
VFTFISHAGVRGGRTGRSCSSRLLAAR